MTPDQIGFWTLVATIVGVLIALVSAVAAILAARYARGGATQESLKTVEENISKVESHLRAQNTRELLEEAVRNVRLTIKGEGWADESIDFFLTVQTPGTRLGRVQLVNRTDLLAGEAESTETLPGVFVATFNRESFARWLHTGDLLPPSDMRVNYLSVSLFLDGTTSVRKVSVTTSIEMRQRETYRTTFYVTSGQA